MHNKVVYRIARGMRRAGAVVLRFNFRGVRQQRRRSRPRAWANWKTRARRSAFLRERYPDLPYSLAGFSFGSRVILRIGTQSPDPKPEKLIAVGVPILRGRLEFAAQCTLPKLLYRARTMNMDL